MLETPKGTFADADAHSSAQAHNHYGRAASDGNTGAAMGIGVMDNHGCLASNMGNANMLGGINNGNGVSFSGIPGCRSQQAACIGLDFPLYIFDVYGTLCMSLCGCFVKGRLCQ